MTTCWLGLFPASSTCSKISPSPFSQRVLGPTFYNIHLLNTVLLQYPCNFLLSPFLFLDKPMFLPLSLADSQSFNCLIISPIQFSNTSFSGPSRRSSSSAVCFNFKERIIKNDVFHNTQLCGWCHIWNLSDQQSSSWNS